MPVRIAYPLAVSEVTWRGSPDWRQPVNMRLGLFGNAVRPDLAPKWTLKFTIQLLFPK